MKRKLLIMLLGTTIALTIVGCGKDEEITKEQVTVTENSEISAQESIATPSPVSNIESEPEVEEVEESEEVEEIKVDFEIEERAAIWKSQTTKVTDRWIQIDDVMYRPGYKMSDLVESASKSEIEYESDYIEDKLVSADNTASVVFTREGVEWFTIHVLNCFGETKSIKDLPVISVTVSEYAKPYCHFGAGFSGSEVLGLPYNDIKTACEAGFAGWTYKEETVWRDDADCLAMTYYSPYEFSILPNAEWTGYDITVGEIAYTFFVDVNTGKVVDFDPNTGFGEAVWSERPEDTVEEEGLVTENTDSETNSEEASDETTGDTGNENKTESETESTKENSKTEEKITD